MFIERFFLRFFSLMSCSGSVENIKNNNQIILDMIEITAKLLRNQSAIYLCGETVEVFITFSNRSLPEHKIAQSNK